jgi:hypothetical protein
MRAQLLRLAAWSVIAALLACLGTIPAEAGSKKGTTPTGHAALVAELHQTRVLLQQANHDYDGYRAKAVHDLGKAMHSLDPQHKHKLPPATNPGNGEDQKKSDAQLNQAGKQIQTMMNQLSTGAATPHTTAAMQHMQSALGHLNTALKIK